MYRVQYSNCWEDAEVVNKALDIKPGGTYFSIASAGDNTLSILSCGPHLVLAVDKNPAQLACLDLRAAAIRDFSYEDTLSFLGIIGSAGRPGMYKQIRSSLSCYARQFWDQHSSDIKHGIIHAGQTEKNFKRFRKFVLPLTMSSSHQKRLLQDMPITERARLCDTVLSKPRYQYTMRSVFSRALIKQLHIGAYSIFYHSSNGNLASTIMKRVKEGLGSHRAHGNPYVTYIMTGNYTGALPYYLQKDVFARIKENLGVLRLFTGSVHDAMTSFPSYRFNGYNLSDIFEYMSAHDIRSCVEQCARAARRGARLVYWNTLKKHNSTHEISGHVCARTRLARELFSLNKSFLYDSLGIAEVV
jgi:S-adenosylmethionine-diacylglycerol 3-amino-3-carboxypropyl transferase